MRRKESNEIINNMADKISDAELIAALKEFGETVQLPIKSIKRPILLKKLNHLRARAKANDVSPTKSKQGSRQVSASTSATTSTKYGNSINNSPDKGSYLKINNRQSPHNSVHNSEDKSVQNSSRSYGFSNLDTFSSDDSDVETQAQAASKFSSSSNSRLTGPSQGANHVSSSLREKPRISNVSDNVLRTLRRRTGELPPQRTRRSEVHELSSEQRSYENLASDSPEESPVPSPARSRLYPNLANYYPNANDDKFESSDSDQEGSTYLVTNKSVNTSFQSYTADNHDDNEQEFSDISFGRGSTLRKTPSAHDSQSIHHRNVTAFPQQRFSSGSHRVQQYKSRYLDLPHILVAIVIVFFVGLSLTYVVIHKDYFFSWLSSPDYMVSRGEKLKCIQDDGVEYKEKELAASLETLKTWFAYLSQRKGQVLCYDKTGVETVQVAELKSLIDTSKGVDASRILSCGLELILANPQWHMRALKDDGSLASTIWEVSKLESSVGDMTLWCRLKRSFVYVLSVLFTAVGGAVAIVLVYRYVTYKYSLYEKEKQEVYSMVDRIIDVLQEHYERTKRDDSEDQPYLAVQHVRDQLLPPATRQQMKPIWDKAVDFIAANESRIRLGTKMIHGEEFAVWHWLPPTSTNGKIWQGQAFGENSENNSNQIIYSPTPCLKIRNMFDSNVESGENWERNVIDAILEKCETIKHIVHIYVDVDSREGCVYLKCSSCEAAGQARQALHGWWFDGRLVTVKFLRTDHYHKRWPESRSATSSLKPSTNQMRSLSQPYYRSSLEMT